VTSVLLAITDVGIGVQWEEMLQKLGFAVKWDPSMALGPPLAGGISPSDVVVVDADALEHQLVKVTEKWRGSEHVPGVIAIGSSGQSQQRAPAARITLVATKASPATVKQQINETARLRLTTVLRWPVARTALGLPPAPQDERSIAVMLLTARTMELDVPKAALRWHAANYVTGTALLQEIREQRVLTVPELGYVDLCDGTLTLQTLLKRCNQAHNAARLLWLLSSIGALTLTPHVADRATPARRLLTEMIDHLRTRSVRLTGSTFYDVLEITPLAEYEDIENAVALLARRFSPELLSHYDLGAWQSGVAGHWQLIEKARSVLVDIAARGRYHDWLRENHGRLNTVWAIEGEVAQQAIDSFARGQNALGDGDVHRALSDFAAACRSHPGHPDYEANLAWTRFRVQVASGADKDGCADKERAHVEQLLLGCRPWPRALVALALLCAVRGDSEAARWYLSQALTVEPEMPAARQLMRRISGAR
jgi:hypothetical protein